MRQEVVGGGLIHAKHVEKRYVETHQFLSYLEVHHLKRTWNRGLLHEQTATFPEDMKY